MYVNIEQVIIISGGLSNENYRPWICSISCHFSIGVFKTNNFIVQESLLGICARINKFQSLILDILRESMGFNHVLRFCFMLPPTVLELRYA